jgi:pimeloyl-ACP methyl ester carboxylesterase
MDWLQLGRGPLPVVIVPGVGDGLRMLGRSAIELAWRYRRRIWSHRLLILGRREPIPSGFGFEQHAADYARAVERLSWEPSIWEGISAGGPIGQCVARWRPDLVRGLILASTTHRLDARLRSIIATWRTLAHDGHWADLYWSVAALNRGPQEIARYGPLRPLLRLVPPPRNPQRFLNLLDGLAKLDNRAILRDIACPTLIIGGAQDRLISVGLQREMAGLIPNSRLVLYPEYGHTTPDEHPDYDVVTRHFMEEIRRSGDTSACGGGSR